MSDLLKTIGENLKWIQDLNLSTSFYFTVGIIITLLIGFFKGMSKGFYKSLYYAITTTILIAAAFFFTPLIMSFIRSFDFTSYNIKIQGFTFTKIDQLPDLLMAMYPDLSTYLADNTLGLSVIELVMAVLSLTLFIVLVWFISTLGWLVQGLFYHILFKHLIPKEVRKKKRRLLGGLMGVVRSFIITSLLFLPAAQIDKISRSINYQPTDDMSKLVIDASQAYGDTFLGKFMNFDVFGFNMNDYLLNHLTSMKIGNQNSSLNQELVALGKAYDYLVKEGFIAVEDGNLKYYPEKLDDAKIEEFTNILFKAKLLGQSIGDVMIMGINIFEKENGSLFENKESTINKLKEIVDWKQEALHFARIYFNLIDENHNILDYKLILNDQTRFENIVRNAGESKVMAAALPLGFEFLFEKLKDEHGNPILNLNYNQKQDIYQTLKNVTDFKKEIESVLNLAKAAINYYETDISQMFLDDVAVNLVANSIDDSTILTKIIPILAEKMISSFNGLSDFGINLSKINFYDPLIKWGSEFRIISSLYKLYQTFTPGEFDFDTMFSAVETLSTSKLLKPQLPSIVSLSLENTNLTSIFDEFSSAINIKRLAGILDYDLEHDTTYFKDSLNEISSMLQANGLGGFDHIENLLESLKTHENKIQLSGMKTLNIYTNGEVSGQETVYPSIFENPALERLPKAIFTKLSFNLFGVNPNDFDYMSLYQDGEISKLFNVINAIENNQSGEFFDTTNDTVLANNLNLLSSSKFFTPVLVDLLNTEFNKLLPPSRQVIITSSDLVGIDWTKEIASLRYLETDFAASTSFEDLSATKIETLFSKVEHTKIISKVIVNELNDYMTTLDVNFTWTQSTLTAKEGKTLGELITLKDISLPSNDKSALTILTSSLTKFDDANTYNKVLVDAMLPGFLKKINNGHTLDETVFMGNPSYTNASNQINTLVAKISAFEVATTIEEINTAQTELINAINATGPLASELILHSGLYFETPNAGVKNYFTSNITNTKLITIVH